MQTKRRIRTTEGIQQRARELRKDLTRAERILWERLRNRQVDGRKFRRQAPLGPFIADFYCPECKLVVEVDGEIHDYQQAYDQERTLMLRAMGCREISFSNHQVEQNPDTVIAEIASACIWRDESSKSTS